MQNLYEDGFDAGLEKAAAMLRAKAGKARAAGNVTADTIARIFEEIAVDILAYRRTTDG